MVRLLIALWPLIKETFFGSWGFSTYLKRHKLITFLTTIIILNCFSVVYLLEQAMLHGQESKRKDEIIYNLKNDRCILSKGGQTELVNSEPVNTTEKLND